MKFEHFLHLPAFLECINQVDDLLDNETDSATRQHISNQVISSLTNPDSEIILADRNAIKIRQLFLHLNPQILIPHLEALFTNTEELRNEKDPLRYAELTAQDGINTAYILMLFLGLTPENKLLNNLAAYHKLTDSINDLADDITSSKVSVQNTPETKNALIEKQNSLDLPKHILTLLKFFL